MTLKIETHCQGDVRIFRLIGRMRGEHVHELQRLMEGSMEDISLDLAEVTIVDAEVITFLAACTARGIPLLNCLTYITNWIAKERQTRA